MEQYKHVGNFFLFFKNKKAYAIAANYESMVSKDYALKDALAKVHYSGTIELDMLLRVGTSENRFTALEFDGEKFVRNSSRIIRETTNICTITSLFFKSHQEVLENCILNEEQKFLIMK